MYYWSMLGLLALGLTLRKDRPSFAVLLGLPVTLGALYFFQHLNHGHAEGFFLGSLWAFGLLALGVTLLVTYSSASTNSALPSRTKV